MLMSQPITANLQPAESALAPIRRWWTIYADLGKARLSALVVTTAALGFVMASAVSLDWALLGWTLLGTTLAAWSANALNQVFERHRDARMKRTRGRPIPSGRIGAPHALGAAILALGMGLTVLVAMVNVLTAVLALLTTLLYVLVYTPLKTRTTLNTLIGSVVGAIPPVMGWTAVTGQLDPGAWVLGTVLFVWQIPHFLALAWLYREDYKRGGYRMLPVIDQWRNAVENTTRGHRNNVV